MKRGKRMKGEHTLTVVENLGEEIPKVEKTIFSALVEDSKKMDQRMSALEKTVSEVKSDIKDVKDDVRNIKETIEDLSNQVSTAINRKQSFWRFLSELIKENRFWLWLILLTLLLFGIREMDLLNILK